MAGCGLSDVILSRGGPSANPLFRWQGLDGTRVTAWYSPKCYNWGMNLAVSRAEFRDRHEARLRESARAIAKTTPSHRWRLRAMFESESLPENRVTLAERRDELGRPLARVEWRLSDRDLHSMSHFMQRLDAAFRRHGLGHIELGFEDDPAHWRRAALGGKYHMGTTRMHRDPRLGVVDADSRVHGTTNLFVAGSSVFPTGGFANPTLTIVALAVRLASHLRQLH